MVGFDSWRGVVGGLGLLLLGVGLGGTAGCTSEGSVRVLIGTHIAGPGKGIREARLDLKSGELGALRLAGEAAEGAYMAVSGDGRRLYVTNSVRNFEGVDHMGGLSAFLVQESGLRLLNSVPSGGENPPYVSLDRTERYVLVANYNGNAVPGEGGSLAVFALNGDGSIGERTGFDQHKGTSVDPVRQTQAYVHSILPDPTNRFLLAADLGLDKVFVYRFDPATGKIQANNPAFAAVQAGSGPRHMAWHPGGKVLYVTQEMGSAVAVFDWDAENGLLTQVQEISMLPAGFAGTSTGAEVRVSRDGRYVYASNRGHDSIVQYAADAAGKLTVIAWTASGGKIPRNFELSPDGKWMVVSNQGDETVAVFAVGPADGKLRQVGESRKVESPFGVRFLP